MENTCSASFLKFYNNIHLAVKKIYILYKYIYI